MKMNKKSLKKRIKITKRGKVMRRIAGISHNRSKKTSAKLNSKKKPKVYSNKITNYKK